MLAGGRAVSVKTKASASVMEPKGRRGKKVFLDPLVLLARKDSQVLKACLDHRDPSLMQCVKGLYFMDKRLLLYLKYPRAMGPRGPKVDYSSYDVTARTPYSISKLTLV
ncbi:hypothetical protein P7K49_013508 [Saguinus oedipus]|uniref:Uncharacterized protein n=1 Tax=Saguinus oedipus TaxID=9490 RepID=A0ABQ9VG77_SAGOE|nr:hypothetical protein P7K49_013508 [Saguinus oedipus]